MKKSGFFRSLAMLALALSLLFAAIPAQASWVDQLWEVYDRMSSGNDDSYPYGDDDSDPYERDDSRSKDDEKSDARNDDGDPGSLSDVEVEEAGEYTSKWEVAAYIHAFGCLPDNYITRKEAERLGWDASKGNLDVVAPGKSIGGSYFGNYEEKLPEKKGRDYYECDIDYDGGYRGAKRIVYSDDGLIFYTEDHYKTFEQLWPEDDG